MCEKAGKGGRLIGKVEKATQMRKGGIRKRKLLALRNVRNDGNGDEGLLDLELGEHI